MNGYTFFEDEGAYAVLLNEPPRSQGDVNFGLLGIPVRIHPLFWLAALVLGANLRNVLEILVWTAAMLLAILVHELGHAGAMRACGFRPSITLYGMGGLTSYNQSQFAAGVRLRPLDQIAIALAGPVAGFVLAGVVCGGMFLSGHRPDVHVGLPYGIDIGPAEMIGSPPLTWLIGDVLFISVFWGLVNLLPVYPLDGGQIAREVLLWLNPREGIGQSLLLSTVVATLLAVCGLVLWRSYLTAFFFGYLAFQSYATLHAYNGRRGPW